MRRNVFYRIAACAGVATVMLGSGYSLQATQGPKGLYDLKKLAPFGPDTKDKDIQLGTKFGNEKDQKYCPANAYDIPGQAWSIGMTHNGLTLRASTTYNDSTIAPKFSELNLLESRPGSGKTDIVVIDRFSQFQVKIDEDGPNARPPIEDLSLRHGNLVIAQIWTLLKSFNYKQSGINPIIFAKNDKKISIYTLEIGEFTGGETGTTRDLAKKLDNQFKTLSNDTTIVNMSFSIIPCEVLLNYRQIRDKWSRAAIDGQEPEDSEIPPQRIPFLKYLEILGQLNGVDADFIKRIMRDVPEDDHFKMWISNIRSKLKQAGESKVIFVASSGNFGLPYSTAPAFWKEVISVGAVNKEGGEVGIKPTEVNWSDKADINTIGEWITLTTKQIEDLCEMGVCISGNGRSIRDLLRNYTSDVLGDNGFGYRGTSFTAPSVTAYLATLNNNNSCFIKTNTGFDPIKKPVDKDAPPINALFDKNFVANCR